jgi:hypothetical protein
MQLRATASPGPLDDTAAPPLAVDDAGAVGGSSAPLWKQALAFAANLIPGNPPPAWKPVHRVFRAAAAHRVAVRRRTRHVGRLFAEAGREAGSTLLRCRGQYAIEVGLAAVLRDTRAVLAQDLARLLNDYYAAALQGAPLDVAARANFPAQMGAAAPFPPATAVAPRSSHIVFDADNNDTRWAVNGVALRSLHRAWCAACCSSRPFLGRPE